MELVQTYISYNLVVNPKDNPIIGFLREGSGDGGDYWEACGFLGIPLTNHRRNHRQMARWSGSQ